MDMKLNCKVWILCLIGLLVVTSATPIVQGENNGDSDYVNDEAVSPTISTKPQKITLKEGSQVQLDCEGQNLEEYSIVWGKVSLLGPSILAVGGLKITANSRLNVFENETLIIQQAVKADSGVYTCRVSTSETKKVTVSHEVSIVSADEFVESVAPTSVNSRSVIVAASLFAFLVIAAIKFWRK